MKFFIAASISIFFIYACNNSSDKTITRFGDYEKFLPNNGNESKKLREIDADIAFWTSRFKKTPDDMASRIKIAGLLKRRFQYSGDIHEIHAADTLYYLVNTLERKSGSGTYRALASNCVTQHQFRRAKLYLDSALALGDNRLITEMQRFDVALELGNMLIAERILYSFKDKNSFEYLIRAAKLKDHAGDLESGIVLMEKALSKIKEVENNSLYCWTKSNLADMYGHDSRFKDAYQSYLDVLQCDPEYYHALKGIAWLAFSHDKDIESAKKIIAFLKRQHPVPDYLLIQAEIAGYENDITLKNKFTSEFITQIKQQQYGDMYNKYFFYLVSDELNDIEEALEIATIEVNNRPTPESYNLLSWAYYRSGDIARAKQIAETYVENKCFEPDALHHLGMIFKAAGEKQKALNYLNQAMKSSFELGPIYTTRIKNELEKI